MVGLAAVEHVLALNWDRDSEIFGSCDVGAVGDWRDGVPELVAALEPTRSDAVSAERRP